MGPIRRRTCPVLSACGAVALLTAAVLSNACGRGGHAPEEGGPSPDTAPLLVTAETALTRPWPATLEVTAGVEPIRRASPGTVLMGRVERIFLREGDRVRAGEPLARIENREVNARLAQAEAAVAAARAVEQNARLTLERIQRLHERQAASRKSLDDAQAAHQAAAAGLAAAEEGVRAAGMYVSYATVPAPFDGMIVERRVEAGDLAAPGVPLFVVEDLSRVKVEAPVPEGIAASLAPGQPVEVEITAAGVRREGTISEILPAADPRSRTVTVRVVLDNPGLALRSGAFARLRLPAGERDAVSVPETALLRQGPLTGLFVLDSSGVVRLRWITAGESRDGAVRILTGLSPGERFVSDPPPALKDGAPVEAR